MDWSRRIEGWLCVCVCVCLCVLMSRYSLCMHGVLCMCLDLFVPLSIIPFPSLISCADLHEMTPRLPTSHPHAQYMCTVKRGGNQKKYTRLDSYIACLCHHTQGEDSGASLHHFGQGGSVKAEVRSTEKSTPQCDSFAKRVAMQLDHREEPR